MIEAVLTNPAELTTTYEEVACRLAGSADYRRLFVRAYRRAPARETINRALIAYVRQLGRTEPGIAASPSSLLFGRVGCTACHTGPALRDGKRHQVSPGRWVRTPTLEAVLAAPFHAQRRSPSFDATHS